MPSSSGGRIDLASGPLELVGGAGHLFEEPDELEAVADLAADWFETHLAD